MFGKALILIFEQYGGTERTRRKGNLRSFARKLILVSKFAQVADVRGVDKNGRIISLPRDYCGINGVVPI